MSKNSNINVLSCENHFIDFITVYDMRGFFQENKENSQKIFETLIGTRNYSNFLRQLIVEKKYFKLAKADTDKYIKNRIFTRRLINDYILDDLTINLLDNFELIEETFKKLNSSEKKEMQFKIKDIKKENSHLTCRIQFSLNGSVLLRIRFEPKESNLSSITHFIKNFHLQTNFNQSLCINIIQKFLREYSKSIDGNNCFEFEDNNKTKKLILTNFENKKIFENLVHLHYFILSTNGFSSGKKPINIQSLKTKNNHREFKKQIMCYMRGTLNKGKCTDVKEYEYPYYDKKIDFVRDLDLSGQNDGLCLITSRKSLIVYNNEDKDYWNGIIRAMELMLCLKNDLTAINFYSNTISQKLTFVSKELDYEKKEKLKEIENELADIISTMQSMKILLVPAMYVSSVSVNKKMDALIESFKLKSITHHIESNIRETNSILSDSFKINLMYEVNGLIKKTDGTQKIILILTLILVFPSVMIFLQYFGLGADINKMISILVLIIVFVLAVFSIKNKIKNVLSTWLKKA